MTCARCLPALLGLLGGFLTPTFAQFQLEPEQELPLKSVRVFKALQGEINWVAFSHDESMIALGSRNSDTVFLYDVETGKERSRLKLDHTPLDPFAFAFSADDKTISWRESFPGSVMRIFETSSGKLVRQFPYGEHNGVAHSYGSCFSPDGKLFAIVNPAPAGKTVELWSVETGREVGSVSHDGPNSCAFSPDGKLLATQDGYGQIRVWDMKGKKVHEFARSARPRQESPMTAVTFSPDGKRLAAAGTFLDDSAVIIWDLETGKKIKEVDYKTRGPAALSAMVFTPHGKWIGVSTRGGFGATAITFWDIESGKKLGVVKADGRIRGAGFVEKSVMFTPSGKYFAAGVGGEVHLYAPQKDTKEPLQFVVPAKEPKMKPDKGRTP
jgi:WD40 repeat protein